eukprot:g2014.t1
MALFDPSSLYGKRAAAAKDQIFQQSMIRIKDPAVSLPWYVNVLGFTMVWHSDFPQWGFSVYFLWCGDPSEVPSDPEERRQFCMNRHGTLELTHNHGTEKMDGNVYNTGNADTTGVSGDGNLACKGGFGHFGITCDDVYVTCERLHSLGVKFKKTPNSGGMKGLAFIYDPDGYLWEILPKGKMVTKDVDHAGVKVEGGQYIDNSK